MIITTAHARQLGWQQVEFDDGLGFRPCTAICAWNPQFRYRMKHKHAVDKHDNLRAQYIEQSAKDRLRYFTWFVKILHVSSFAKCGGQPSFLLDLDYRFEHTHCYVKGPLDKNSVRMTLDEAKLLHKDIKTLGWLTPSGLKLSDEPEFTMFGVYSYQLAKKEVKWKDLPVGTLVVDAWGNDLEYRGEYAAGNQLLFEHRNKAGCIDLVYRYANQLVKLSYQEKWLVAPTVPTGIRYSRHPNYDCLARVIGLLEGYVLC